MTNRRDRSDCPREFVIGHLLLVILVMCHFQRFSKNCRLCPSAAFPLALDIPRSTVETRPKCNDRRFDPANERILYEESASISFCRSAALSLIARVSPIRP